MVLRLLSVLRRLSLPVVTARGIRPSTVASFIVMLLTLVLSTPPALPIARLRRSRCQRAVRESVTAPTSFGHSSIAVLLPRREIGHCAVAVIPRIAQCAVATQTRIRRRPLIGVAWRWHAVVLVARIISVAVIVVIAMTVTRIRCRISQAGIGRRRLAAAKIRRPVRRIRLTTCVLSLQWRPMLLLFLGRLPITSGMIIVRHNRYRCQFRFFSKKPSFRGNPWQRLVSPFLTTITLVHSSVPPTSVGAAAASVASSSLSLFCFVCRGLTTDRRQLSNKQSKATSMLQHYVQ